MSFFEFMVKIPFRERAAAAAKLCDGTRTSRCGKALEASKGRLAASRNARGSFSGRTSTSGPALVITAKGEGGHRKNRRRHRRARAHRTPQPVTRFND